MVEDLCQEHATRNPDPTATVRMKREFKAEATAGKPQVVHREGIRRQVEGIEYTHK